MARPRSDRFEECPGFPGRRRGSKADTWIDPAAQVFGDVVIEAGASVWPGAIVCGDQDNYAQVGRNTNVQDCAILHVRPEAGWLVMGVPARPVRKMSPEELEDILRNAQDHLDLWRRDYAEGRSRPLR